MTTEQTVERYLPQEGPQKETRVRLFLRAVVLHPEVIRHSSVPARLHAVIRRRAALRLQEVIVLHQEAVLREVTLRLLQEAVAEEINGNVLQFLQAAVYFCGFFLPEMYRFYRLYFFYNISRDHKNEQANDKGGDANS